MSDETHIPFGLQWPGKAEAAAQSEREYEGELEYEPSLSHGLPTRETSSDLR